MVFEPVHGSIVIGACGHRSLDSEEYLAGRVREAVRIILGKLPRISKTPLDITVISPLAEGADRLIAGEILKMEGAKLKAVLPMETMDYINDFGTEESEIEFKALLGKADEKLVIQPQERRVDAYEKAGRYVVDHCDILIALWDGKPGAGKGGTADTIQYARRMRRPLIWIQTNMGNGIAAEWGNGLNTCQLAEIEQYNTDTACAAEIENGFKQAHRFYLKESMKVGLSAGTLGLQFRHILKHHIRADRLATHYQHLHFGSDTLVTLLALVAVITAALQAIILPEFPTVLFLEVLMMAAVLSIVLVARRRRWHNKWIDYRYLAERLRSALFMSLTGVDVFSQRQSGKAGDEMTPGQWTVCTFLSVWAQSLRFPKSSPVQHDALNKFISTAWIDNQVQYHSMASRKLHRRHHILSLSGYILFTLTIFVALLHMANFKLFLPEALLAFIAIALPAVAASIMAIRIQRDYLRKALRSSEMVHRLPIIKNRLLLVGDYKTLFELVKETDETMMAESESWRDLVWLHRPEVPV